MTPESWRLKDPHYQNLGSPLSLQGVRGEAPRSCKCPADHQNPTIPHKKLKWGGGGTDRPVEREKRRFAGSSSPKRRKVGVTDHQVLMLKSLALPRVSPVVSSIGGPGQQLLVHNRDGVEARLTDKLFLGFQRI